jgi:hypothetical protein
LYSLAGPPCPTNKDEENVVIKKGCNIFTIISLWGGGVALITAPAAAFALRAIVFDTPQCEIWPPYLPNLKSLGF